MLSAAFCVVVLAQTSWANASTIPAPDADYLLQAEGLPTQFWHKDVVFAGADKRKSQHWIVTGARTPYRGEDGVCIADAQMWSLSINPAHHVSMDNDAFQDPNPTVVKFLNFDPQKHAAPCEQIPFPEYFSVDDGISVHQAFTLINELKDTVTCVKQGDAHCAPWTRIDISPDDRKDFLKLNQLRIAIMEWDDPDIHNTIVIQYLLIAPDKTHPMPWYLVAYVHLLPDGATRLEITEGGPDPA